MTSSSVKYSVFRALQLLSLLALLFANVSIHFIYSLSFSLNTLEKVFTMIISVNTLHFIPVPISGHLYPPFCEASNLAATDEKVNFVRSCCQPKLQQLSFSFIQVAAAGPGHQAGHQRVKL